MRVRKASPIFVLSLAIFGLCTAWHPMPAQATPTVVPARQDLAFIQAIHIRNLEEQVLEIAFRFSGPPRAPTHFRTGAPPRLVLDFVKTNSLLKNTAYPIRQTLADALKIVEADDRVRAIIDLKARVTVEIRAEPRQIFVTLRRIESVPAEPPPLSTRKTVTDVQFRRGDENQARILVSLSDPTIAVDVDPGPERFTVDFIGADLAPDLERRLDMSDSGTAASFIDISRHADSVRLVIHANAAYTPIAYQTGHLYTLELSHKQTEPDKKEQAEKERPAIEHDDKRLSLNFQEISTRAALRIIADSTDTNIVINDSVDGVLTLRLEDVPWKQALDLILRSQGLAMRRDGDIILVGALEELAEQERRQLESQATLAQLQSLQSRFFKLNYARAAEILALISGQGDHAEKTDASSRDATPFLLSPRGSAVSDVRTNTLIVHDTPDHLDSLSALIERIDRPVPQVMIESRIVNVDDNAFLNLGARLRFIQKDAATDASADTSINGGENLITAFPVATLGGSDPANLFFLIGSQGRRLLQLELSALEQDGLAETVSTPRVITADQRKANISQGFLIPFQEVSSSGSTATTFQQAMLSLTVTPRITPDRNIIMDLSISDDSPTAGSTNITTRSVNTRVRVKSGDTVVLGGVMKVTRSKTETKVPLLGDLPVLGFLFRNTTELETKSELLVFVTPTLLPEDD